jgi:ABC-type transporter MlaC component
VLAQYWRTATPEQQKRFVSALYKALLHTYGGGNLSCWTVGQTRRFKAAVEISNFFIFSLLDE